MCSRKRIVDEESWVCTKLQVSSMYNFLKGDDPGWWFGSGYSSSYFGDVHVTFLVKPRKETLRDRNESKIIQKEPFKTKIDSNIQTNIKYLTRVMPN